MAYDPASLELRHSVDQPVHILRREFKGLIGLSLAVHLLISTPSLLGLPFTQAGEIVDASGNIDWNGMGLVYGLGALSALLALPGMLVLFAAVRDRLDGAAIDPGRALRQSLRLSALGAVAIAGIGSILGLLMCILPGVFVATILGLTQPIAVAERGGTLQILRRSVELARFRSGTGSLVAWNILLTLVVWFVISQLANLVVAVPIGAYSALATVEAASQGGVVDPAAIAAPWWLTGGLSLVNLALRAVIDLYVVIGLTRIYQAAHVAMTGDALEAMIEAEHS